MPPFRSHSETRKASGTATSGKKAAKQRQAVKDTPVHSALNSDAPGQGPTYQCGAYLRDLNDDEKKKVANLIQQIVHLGSKVQSLEDENAKLKRKSSDELQSPLESATAHNNAELRSKLASAVAMLRSCQQIILQRKDNSSSTAAGLPQLPDIDRFAASCEDVGVAEQRASTGNSGFPFFSQNQNPSESREWKLGQQSRPNTPQSPRTDAAASSFSFPQPPPEDAHAQAPRDSSRASSTPQPRPKRSRKSQSPLPRSPGRVPEPYQPAQPSNQLFESPTAPYLSPGTYLGSQPGTSHATGAGTKPTSPPAPQPTAPYLSQQQSSPYPPPGTQDAPNRDSQHSKSPRNLSPRPATPTSPSRIQVTPNATAQSSSPQQSPKRSSSPRTSALWRSSQPISKPPGTFGTSPRFDYLSAAPTHFLQSTSPRKSQEGLARTRNARGSVSPHEHGDRAAQDSTSPLGTQPANTQESQQAKGSEARCLEATLNPGDFLAACATAATTGDEPVMQHVAAQPVDTGGPQQQAEVAGAVLSINPTQHEYQNYSVHLQHAAINGHPSSNWRASELPGGGAASQPSYASHQNTQQHHPQLDSIYNSAHQQQSHPGRTFRDSPTGNAAPVPATSAVPESSAGDPSVTTPPSAHPHRSSVEAPFPVSGAQHSMSAASLGVSQPIYPPDAPEATIDSCGSAIPDHSGGSGGAWQGIGAPWSTFAQNGGPPVSQVPPCDAPLSEIGDRASPSDVGSGGSISQAAREVSFQEAEDVHVHIHFDAPQVHAPPQNPPFSTHPPYLQGPSNPPPPNFSPDFMDAHFRSVPQGRRVSPHRPVMHSPRQAPAPLAPPPALPLQPLTRLVEFDDSLADLVSQVEASMHVTGSGTTREASAREGSSACAVLAELAPYSQQDPAAYRGDSVTSVPAHSSDALEMYMHEEHAYSTQPPRMPSQTVLLSNRVNSAHSSPSEASGERLQSAQDRDAPRNMPASKLVSSRCGEVRTTSRCGKVHTLAANSHRSDTSARAGGSWGENGARSRGQENSLRGSWGASRAERDSIHTLQWHKGGSIPQNNSSDRPARVGLKERSSVHAHDDYSFRAGMGKSGEYSNQFRSMRHSKLSNSQNSRQLGSPSCLDDDDKEMLDVLNCLM